MLMVLDIPMILPPGDLLEFGDKQLGRGLQSAEEELPNDAPGLSTDQSIHYPFYNLMDIFPCSPCSPSI
jgi:hypothetical protein